MILRSAAAHRPRGVTAIELIAAISVTSIVSALAYSAYRTHAVRAQVAAGIISVARMQRAVEDDFRHDGDVPASLAGSIVQLEVTAGDSARLDAPPPTDVASLVAALRKMLPGNVWTATLSVAEDGVAIDGVVVKDLPASAQDKLRPGSRTQRAVPYKPIARTVSPAKRVLNGTTSMMVRIADK